MHNEQLAHQEDLLENVERLEQEISLLDSSIHKVSQSQYVLEDEHKEIRARLYMLEQISLNIERETFAYAQNTSLNFFGSQDEEIDALFDEARDTHLYIERFIRTAERKIDSKSI